MALVDAFPVPGKNVAIGGVMELSAADDVGGSSKLVARARTLAKDETRSGLSLFREDKMVKSC